MRSSEGENQHKKKGGRGWGHGDNRLKRSLVWADLKICDIFIYGLAFESSNGEVPVGSEDAPLVAQKRIVESCACPENFAGYSCESCVKGYRRVNNQLYGGRCEKCNCGGHSEDCDPETGRCLNCQHNTTGDRCERCLDGHYGNPSLGGEAGSCQPCACPSIDNRRVFRPGCLCLHSL
ncbi:hypothetical protein L596_029252 [Steinernema carpocapsae]|uniref:Laminin EGF-like domain-containing protein n=1 Tax=Steinernema carpocapsae TaxID=34508 RepID=A0A4U5LU36_STECR|nr:hypothetical protein L596_029252 [Steinernema carpocapsae]